MNILYLCGGYGLRLDRMLGPKVHIYNILNGLQKAGHNPYFLAIQETTELPEEFASFNPILLPHKYLRGFVHKIIPYTGIVDSLRIFITIVRLHRKVHLDIIHERYTGLSWGGLLVAKILNIPYILELNGPGVEEKTIQMNPLQPSKKWILLTNQKILLSYCNQLILASGLIASFIRISRGWKLHKYHVLLNGAELPRPINLEEKYAIRKKFRAENQPLFLYSGSLYLWYGSINVVRAFRTVLKIFPDIKLVLIGAGDAEIEIKNFIKENHLDDMIFLTGALAHADLQKYIQAADYCLVYYPGEPTYFGTSTKLTEYMAAGKPVIATPHMFEMIDDGITGFLSKSAKPKDFADKIIEVLNNKSFAIEVGQNARRKIEKLCTWQHYIQNLLAIYSMTIER